MSRPRRLALLVVLVLLGAIAQPALAAQLAGETWTSQTYGFTVSWAGTEWQADPSGTLTAVGPERLDRLHLINGVSSLYFEGATRYEGDLSACVAAEANLLSEESGVTEIRPYVDEDGVQFVASGPDAEAAAFALTLSAPGQEIDLVDYVECRTLIPGRAVLVITLVTAPDAFKSEMAAAQPVIDSIEMGVEAPTNPLEAYGGWLAAATAQPSIAGPLSGDLAFAPGQLAVARAGVDAPDAYIRAEFANPTPAAAPWDFGIGFRDSGGEDQFRLVVDAAGNWFFKDSLGPVIAGGTLVDVDASPGGSNVIEIVAAGDTGYFAFNERLVTALDLSARPAGGDAFVGAGFFDEDASGDGVTPYANFEIWSLEGLSPGAAQAPAVDIDAASFADLSQRAGAEAPLAGPASGELTPEVGTAAIQPAGVEAEDFVAAATFVNPADAADARWDMGIAFREQASGDHYRLIVSSDGNWKFQIGLQAPLASGAVSSMSFERGAANTVEIVVAGDAAGFAVNGMFVSALDVAALRGPSDVWVGSGFQQANVVDEVAVAFESFTVWPLIVPAAATPVPAATPVGGAEQIALRLLERNDSGIDALAVLVAEGDETSVTVTARGAAGGEVVVIEAGTCAAGTASPEYLLEDLDPTGRSETTVPASLGDLSGGAHSIAIHRSAEAYGDVVACGDIVPAN